MAAPNPGCAKADTEAERIVCGDARLARMDREVGRLYALAAGGEYMTAARLPELRETQRQWLESRAGCLGRADRDRCLTASYALRVHQLRQGYADARSDDAAGISNGPLAVRCRGLDALIGATFINADPGVVYLEWLDRSLALTQAPSGSGARYIGAGSGGDYSFWTKSDGALFGQPGAPELTCSIEPIG